MNKAPTFKYLEEYIEFIGGYRSATGKVHSMFDHLPVPINLARYDVNFIQNVSEQTTNIYGYGSKNVAAYTDRQAELAYAIVDKYRKQLLNLKPPVIVPERVRDLQLKHGLRQVDRTKSVTIADGNFVLKFPYDRTLIELIKTQMKEGNGAAKFDGEKKVWVMAMTEDMLNWIMAICPGREFVIDEEIHLLYRNLQDMEQTPFAIELGIVVDQPVILNAPSSMLDYINTNLGGLSLDNLLVLVDNGPVLGYNVSSAVTERIKAQYPQYWDLVRFRKSKFSKSSIGLKDIVEYARLTNRLPVHVYENGLPKESTDGVIYLNRGISYNVHPKLLVTTTNLMIGSRKESWVMNSEKMIYLE